MTPAAPATATIRTPSLTAPLTRARLPLFAVLVLFGVGQAVGTIGTALLMQAAFNALLGSGQRPTGLGQPGMLAGGLVAAVAVGAWMRAMEQVAAERLGQHYVMQVRADLFHHLTQVPARELGRRNSGHMLLRFVGDLSALRSWMSLGLARLLVAGIAVTLAVGALIVIDTGIGLAIASVLAVGGAATWRTNGRLRISSGLARNRRAKLTGEVTERLSHIGVLQSAGQEDRERRRVGRYSQKVSDAMVERARAAGLSRAVAEATAGFTTVAVVVVGTVEVRSGHTSPGAVVGAVAVAGLLAGHLRDLGRVAQYAAAARVARDAARRFLALPTLPDPIGQPDLRPGPGDVQLVGLTVPGALAGVTLHAAPGKTVVIVGANGAGKSTLVGLAARLLDPESGQVLLDGQDLRSRSLASVRAAVGVAGPDLPLLRGTVERNVLYRQPRADEQEVARVTELCGLDALVAELPGGWQAEVGQAGSRLSAGQRARITVSRAVLGNPRLLILDEAEAHLDRAATDMVDRVLSSRTGTTLVVTHRRELVKRADVVWCLLDGRVAEVGPPDVLMAGDGPTARLLGTTGGDVSRSSRALVG